MTRIERWDGQWWGICLVVALLASSLGCFGLAMAQTGPMPQAEILTTDNCPPPADI